MTSSKTKILAYIPVVHLGYVKWLSQHPEAEVFILGRSITSQFRSLQKDVRALEPEQIVQTLEVLKLGQNCQVIEQAELTKLTGEILMPDEEVSRKLANTDLSGCQIKFESIWLRWDRSNITGPKIIQPDLNWQIQQLTQTKTITNDPDQQWLIQAASEAVRSADWWRQVGVVVVKAGKLLLKANNHHLPAEQQAYVDGDPRAEFHQGEAIELTTAIHAEADLIAQAAKQGLALKDATMFVTTFPCPYCAKLIARSGIKKLIYQTGYSMLQGEEVLKSAGVELIQLS